MPVALKKLWQVDLGGKLSSVVAAGDKVLVADVDAHTVYAVDANTGKTAWSYTVGGRVDSPPTILCEEGLVLFGSADGWVYCLRAADGQLAWRFRVAPEDRRLVAYDQLESAWPVSGALLVEDGAVYCLAGRSAFLDGGMRLVRLDPKTGKKLSETVLDNLDPATGEDLQAKMQGQDMPVALPDILSSDGQSVYMRAQAFDMQGVRREVAPIKLASLTARRGDAAEADERADVNDHLFSRSGFLDDSWFWRSYWIYGKAVESNYGGWLRPGHFAPSGRLIVFDDQSLYGFDRKPEYLCNASVAEYYLYGADRKVDPEAIQRVAAGDRRINAASTDKSASSSDWATRKKFPLTDQNVASFHWAEGNPPIQARAMVLAGETLFVAGPPDLVNEEEAFRNPDDPQIQAGLKAQADALLGKHGGQILAVSAADGKTLAAYELGAAPTFDGMAAARGRLYLSTLDGRLICLGGEGEPLDPASDVALVSLDTTVKPAPPDETPAAGPSLSGDFSKVTAAEVTASELGYHLASTGKGLGLAVNKLPAPLSGKIELKLRVKVTPDAPTKNGFLVFGDAAKDASLVKCGLRYIRKEAVIVEGPFTGGKVTDAAFEPDEAKVYEIDVTIDLPSSQVTMKSGDVTVTAALDAAPAGISFIGYAVSNSAADFSKIEISGP